MKNTSSHGFELEFIVTGGAKHEFQIMSEPIGNKTKIVSKKTELLSGLEFAQVAYLPVTLIIRNEIDHLTGDSVINIAVNASGKAGSLLVVDAGGEFGFKLRLPNKKNYVLYK